MIEKIIKSIFGDPDKKKIKKYEIILEEIRKSEEQFKDYGEEEIKQKTEEFKSKFKDLNFKNPEDSKKINQILDEIKVEALALMRHTCEFIFNKETWNENRSIWIPHDVQIIGALALQDWGISEMKTWEWKTLVATMPAYLNALTWNSVHIVTVNDYLAKRDAEEMKVLYNTLWLSVWVISHDQSKKEKIEEYQKDIVYATNNELGFDYLRDNMVTKKEHKAQWPLFFAIIDEVDSILIDEARTPLIISMPDNEPTSKYQKFALLAEKLQKGIDYKIDEKQKAATLTEEGIEKIETLLKVENIYISSHYNDLHHIENAIRAQGVYKKDKDYIVTNGEVMIVDEHTWRVLSWRRYSDGLHQALEAKEKVEIQQESKTLASITFQNYFRMYWKLSGMTGTAKTEEEEFYKVYALDTLVIPTNKPIDRKDKKDLLFKNEKGKFEYVVKLIKEIHEKWQPILVWTVSVDKSEYLSDRLKVEWVPHNVLNAKYHEQEAEIISKAWEKWAITIATNMAWRWTDIKLWEWVVELGGLTIIWTEKHETRRIDNQLRWRAWRQWDPWTTQFLVSPNDDIMRIFWGDKFFSVFNSPMFASVPDNEPLLESPMLTKKITSVQKQVEGHNFDSRKHVLEYDDVINKHREVIYGKRNKILDSENIDSDIQDMIRSQLSQLILALYWKKGDNPEKEELIKTVNDFLDIELIEDTPEIDKILWEKWEKEIVECIWNMAIEKLQKKKDKVDNQEDFYRLERRIVLRSIDDLWMRHIDWMSRLREEVAFEWYAQKNPLIVYKEKAFFKFEELINEIEYKVVKSIFAVEINTKIEQNEIKVEDLEVNEEDVEKMLNGFIDNNVSQDDTPKNQNPLFANPNVGRGTIVKPKQEVRKKKIRV